MSLQDITITGSIKSIATQSYGQRTYISSTDEQSFPIETITGSQAGVWPNFIPNTNLTTGLVVNITQSWSGSNITPTGIVPYIHGTMEEFIDGEFSGSDYTVSNGDLTDPYCQQFLIANNKAFKYSIFPYASQSLYPFNHTNTMPRNGEALIYYVDSPNPIENVMYAKISRIDKDGIDLTNTLSQLTVGNYIEWIDAGIGLVKLEIENRTDNATYFLFKFKPNLIITPGYFDDNYLNYTFRATSSFSNFTASINGNTYYLTYGVGAWNVTADSASGWNPTSEQYFFPLSPNTDIYTTASISMSINAPVTFSWGIQAWQTSTNQIIDGIPSTVPIYNNANKLYLNAGQHNLIITSSTYQPIEGYAYEIDLYAETQHYISNEFLIGTGSNDQPLSVPSYWRSWDFNSGNTFDNDSDPSSGWQSAFYALNLMDTIPGSPGGVININDSQGKLLTWYNVNPSDELWNSSDNGKKFDILVEIPYFDNQGVIYGPSSEDLKVVTCARGATNTMYTSSLIGTIPSGASGIFNFEYTLNYNAGGGSTSGDRRIGIYAPVGSTVTDNYAAVTRIAVSPVTTASVHDLKWSMTQSNIPQTSTSSFIFEPYFPYPFYNTDCDVLMNNYSENDYSNTYREVLYDNGGTIPSNLQQIISGTAQYAEINDYLYNASANRLPRYNGVRSESPGFNMPSTYNGYGALPNVEQTTTYFAYFDNLKANWPIFKNTTSPIIKYLIREDGEVINPSLDEATYYNMIDSFPRILWF